MVSVEEGSTVTAKIIDLGLAKTVNEPVRLLSLIEKLTGPSAHFNYKPDSTAASREAKRILESLLLELDPHTSAELSARLFLGRRRPQEVLQPSAELSAQESPERRRPWAFMERLYRDLRLNYENRHAAGLFVALSG
jgi:hypothetical protein